MSDGKVLELRRQTSLEDRKMPDAAFSNLLVDSSAALLQCGEKVEGALRHVLNVADTCSPEIALVTADSLTKLTRDIGAAPIFFAEKTKADGQEMRHVVEVLAIVLNKARPDEVRNDKELETALKTTAKACAKFKLGDECSTLFQLLTREIARVFFELRAVLRRQKNVPSKRLFRSVQNYMRRARQAILCFSYNSLKVRVCIKSIDACGAKSTVDKAALRKVVKNVYDLQRNTRTMAVLAQYHHETVKKAMALAKG